MNIFYRNNKVTIIINISIKCEKIEWEVNNIEDKSVSG